MVGLIIMIANVPDLFFIILLAVVCFWIGRKIFKKKGVIRKVWRWSKKKRSNSKSGSGLELRIRELERENQRLKDGSLKSSAPITDELDELIRKRFK